MAPINVVVNLAAHLLREVEGLRLKAYPDPASGGEPWTIGYGQTGGIKPGDVWTKEKCEEALLSTCRDIAEALARELGDLEPECLAALVSFAYNVGPRQWGISKIRRLAKAGDLTGASGEFLRWVFADGRPYPPLLNRRQKERALFDIGAERVKLRA